MDGERGGDPSKLAVELVQPAALELSSARFAAGADVVANFETKARTLLAQGEAHRGFSCNLARDVP